jgi:hypothetical protein
VRVTPDESTFTGMMSLAKGRTLHRDAEEEGGEESEE